MKRMPRDLYPFARGWHMAAPDRKLPQYTIIIVPVTTILVLELPLKPRILDESTVEIDKL